MFKNTKGILICLIVISLGLSACGNKEKAINKNSLSSKRTSSVESVETDNLPMSDTVDTVIKVPDREGNSKDISIVQKKFIIYTIDSESEQVVPKTGTVMSDETLKPESVVDSVILELDGLIDGDIDVKLEKKDGSVTVDFSVSDKKYPFGKKHKAVETKILECISYSILDNFTDYKKIYFKLNGEAYISKQLKLPGNKPFMADE